MGYRFFCTLFCTRIVMYPKSERFQGLDLLTIGVLVVDLHGKILFANLAAESLFGKSEKLLRDGHYATMIDGAESWIQSYANNPSINFTVQGQLTELHCSPQESVQVYISINPVTDNPNQLIIELVPAQLALQQRQERRMSELSEQTRRLLRNLAHEIKNPLGGIRGAAQLLQSELKDPENREYTEVIISEADRLQVLVDKILVPYRCLYQPCSVNIHEILERVRKLVESEFSEGLEIIRDYDISVPDMTGDKGQLTQIFLNVLRNSAEALTTKMIEGNAQIILRTRVVHHVFIGQIRYKTALNIQVIENGEGIPKELQESVFYPLVSSKTNGSGLGLSLVQAFVEQHGGTIDLKSNRHGTNFGILFPLSISKNNFYKTKYQ